MATSVTENLDYRQTSLIAGLYDLVPASKVSSPTSISLGGGETSVWNLPSSISANLPNIQHSFTYTFAAKALIASWLYMTMIPLRSIAMRYGGTTLLNLSEAYIFSNMVAPMAVSFDEFMQNDIGSGTIAFVKSFEGLRRSNGITTTQANFAVRPDNTAADVFYTEFSYILPSSAVNTASPQVRYKYLMGRMFPYTIFSTVEDMWFNNDVSITFTWEALTKVSFEGDSITDPSSNPATQTNVVTFENETLLIPAQRNQEVVKLVRDRFFGAGSKYTVFEPQMQAQTLSGTSQQPSITVSRGAAQRVAAVVSSLYNSTQSSNTALDRSSLGAAKMTSFYTTTNGNRNESTLITVADADNFTYQKDILPRSPYMQSSNILTFNWIWATPYGLRDMWELARSDSFQGFDVSESSFTYNINATVASGTYRWFIFAILQKELNLQDGNITYA